MFLMFLTLLTMNVLIFPNSELMPSTVVWSFVNFERYSRYLICTLFNYGINVWSLNFIVTGFGHHGIFKRNRINLNICKKWRTKLDPNFLNTQVPILVNYFIQIIEEKYENSRLNRDTRETRGARETRGTREAKQSKEKRENKETRELKPKVLLFYRVRRNSGKVYS